MQNRVFSVARVNGGGSTRRKNINENKEAIRSWTEWSEMPLVIAWGEKQWLFTTVNLVWHERKLVI